MITENVSTLKIHKLTQEQYNRELENGNIDENALYLTPDEEVDLSIYATIKEVNQKADKEHTHDEYVDKSYVDEQLENVRDSIENITIDATLSDTSENPVQNKVINIALNTKVDKIDGHRLITSSEADKLEALVLGDGGQVEISGKVNADNVEGLDDKLNLKVDKVNGKGLSTNDYTNEDKEKLANLEERLDSIENEVDKTVIDSVLSESSVNAIQNKVVTTEINNLKTLIDENAEAISDNAEAINNISHPVSNVNGKTGNVILTASDVGALPEDTEIPSIDGLATTVYVDTELNKKSNSDHTHSQYLEAEDIAGKADKTELHEHDNRLVLDGISADRVSSWDNKSDFDGNYNSLEGKPNILDDELSELNIADRNGNIIFKVDINGVHTTSIEADTLVLVDEDIGLKLDSKAAIDHTHDEYITATDPVGTGSFSMNRLADSTVGDASSTFGMNCEASGKRSHAEGYSTIASGDWSHAEGFETIASGICSHAEGYNTTASGEYSHAECGGTTASGSDSHAEGSLTEASGSCSHAEGYSTIASGDWSHAEGEVTEASGSCSHAEGYRTIASGAISHAEGYGTIADSYQHASGKYNTPYAAPDSASTQNTDGADAIFIVGCGTSSATKNAFRIASGGQCYGASSFTGSGADFAELFEWADGNLNNEDRRGLFVTFDGDKIKLANTDDDYIGIISGSQAFIGNSASEEWHDKYLTDVFGTKLSQEVEVPAELDEVTGEVIKPASTTTQYILNPDYNPDEEYVMRENRKEWGIVGLLGQVVMIDDGTCVVGGRVEPSVNGVGTASDKGYRVMKRIDETHIKVLVK